MPFSMCPLCGQVSHLSVGDVKEWYEKYYPQIPFGKQVPGRCLFCFPELKHGDSVVIRRVFTEEQNTHKEKIGIIKEILSSQDGSLFVVQMDAGKELYFIRAQLRKLREGEIRPNVVAD